MIDRPLHRVTTKAALIDSITHRVLTTELINGKFGLPGGQLESGEEPDQAIVRELAEELGLSDIALTRIDFWKDPSSHRVILAYIGSLKESQIITVDGVEVVGFRWVSRSEIERDSIDIPTYRDFLLAIL